MPEPGNEMLHIQDMYMQSPDKRVQVGMSRDGDWIAALGPKMIRLDRRKNYLGLLPLLESEPSVVILASKIEPPAEELIRFALSCGSGYWVQLALGWLTTLQVWDEEMAQSLFEISQNRGWSSKLLTTVNSILRMQS
jgi:hypothetical protein